MIKDAIEDATRTGSSIDLFLNGYRLAERKGGVMKFIKKPVVVDAVQFTKEMAEGKVELPEGVIFCSRTLNANNEFHPIQSDNNFEWCHKHIIETLEGDMRVQIGDWVITGVNGEHYPCKPDIFEKTYEVFECLQQDESGKGE